MRILYLILFVTLKYALRIYYPRIKIVNGGKRFFGRTIYVSNHPGSFMDPLVVASLQRPIVFFMTRSDVFTPISKPFLWACQMLPIYRQLDGGDTKGKNKEVFTKASKVLKNNRNLLVFGEGFTDDVFIRRLKPVKKGAVKMGFQALESINWRKKIYIAGTGINYSEPNKIGSDLLISTSEKICLNDYESAYKENPTKTELELTRKVEQLMRDQITYVAEKENAPFHENIMIITRQGMNARSFDPSISLEERWNHSQNLAKWINEQDVEHNERLQKLKKNLEGYMSLLKRMKLTDGLIFWKKNNGNRSKELTELILLFPFMILGMIHFFIPYILIKRFTEKSFKRKVFWGSVKMIMGLIIMGLINIPYIFLFHAYIYPSWSLAILYYFLTGIFGWAAYKWFEALKAFKIKGMVAKTDVSKLIAKRDGLEKEIEGVIFK